MAKKDVDYNSMTPAQLEEYIANQKSGVVGTHSFQVADIKLILQKNGDAKGLIVIDPNDTASLKYNPSGKFWLTMGQLDRLCNDAGVPSPMALKHLIAMPGRTTYEAEIQLRVKGEIFVNEQTGEIGVFGEKTDKPQTFATRNESIKLGPFATQKLADEALKQAFSTSAMYNAFGGTQNAAPVAAPVVYEAADEADEESDDDSDIVGG